mmetsp:Transcript_35733/g.93134  ORF Transcript_35733/g.93134 Transcript_35733/m.93134 type:complete len:215 (-) Transcript_35733:245-889(-)
MHIPLLSHSIFLLYRQELADAVQRGIDTEYPWVRTLRLDANKRGVKKSKDARVPKAPPRKITSRSKSPRAKKSVSGVIAAAVAEAATKVMRDKTRIGGRQTGREEWMEQPFLHQSSPALDPSPSSSFVSGRPFFDQHQYNGTGAGGSSSAMSEIRTQLAKEYADMSRRYQQLCLQATDGEKGEAVTSEMKHLVEQMERRAEQLRLLRSAQATSI